MALQGRREQRERRAEEQRRYEEQRQAQYEGQLLGLIQQDPQINIDKLAPPGLDRARRDRILEIQKAIKRQIGEREKQGQIQAAAQQIPGMIAGGQPGLAKQSFEAIAGAGGPEALARASQQAALGLPGAEITQRQERAKSAQEYEKGLPEGIRINLFALRSGAISSEESVANVREMASFAGVSKGTEFERLARKAERGNASDVEQLRLWTLATGGNAQTITIGPDGTVSIETGSGAQKFLKEIQQVQSSVDMIEDVMDSLNTMGGIVAESPETAGVGARILTAVQAGKGLADSIYAFTGNTTGYNLLERGREVIAGEIAMGSPEALRDAKRLGMVDKDGNLVGATGPGLLDTALQVSRLEAEQILASYALAGAIRTGSGRLTVHAVKEMKSLLNFKNVRGPGHFLTTINTINHRLGSRLKKKKQRAKQNFGLSFEGEGDLGPIEVHQQQRGAQPAPPSAPTRGAPAPRETPAVYVIRNGRLVPKGAPGAGGNLPPLPPPGRRLPPLPQPENR
jgi:hypothetical protein